MFMFTMLKTVQIDDKDLFTSFFFKVNGMIKNWKFFTHTIQNSSLPWVGDCLDIVCALINKYHRPAIADIEEGYRIVCRMREMWNVENELQNYLQKLNEKKGVTMEKIRCCYVSFPNAYRK